MIINRFILSIITLLFIDNNSYSKEIKEKQLSAAEKQRLELLDNYKIKRMTKEELQEKAKYLESLPSDDVNKIQLDMKKINNMDMYKIGYDIMNFSADDYLGKWRDTTGRNYDSTITKTKYGKYHINYSDGMFDGICDIIEQRRNELILRCVGDFIPGSGIRDVKEFIGIKIFYSNKGRMVINILFTPSLECAKKHDFMSDECYFTKLRYLEKTGKFGTVYHGNAYYKIINEK